MQDPRCKHEHEYLNRVRIWLTITGENDESANIFKHEIVYTCA